MSITIQNKNQYVIDILDGDGNVYYKLKFNLDDINLTARVIEFYNNAQIKISEIQKEQEEARAKVISTGVEEIEKVVNVTEDNILELPENVKEFYKVQVKGFQVLRELLDNFLGKGTCEKIFGDVNSYSMFESFIYGLIPEFEKMGIKVSNMKKQMYQKYKVDNGKVLR